MCAPVCVCEKLRCLVESGEDNSHFFMCTHLHTHTNTHYCSVNEDDDGQGGIFALSLFFSGRH